MSERASYGKLGLFVVVSVGMLLVGMALLGAGAFKSKGYQFETYFSESVDGLEVGAPVKHKGVTVGKVTGLKFIGSKYAIGSTDRTREQQMMAGWVVVEMELELWSGLTQENWQSKWDRTTEHGLRAQLTTAGLMGATYVEISFVDPEYNPPMKIAWTPDRLYVPSKTSTMGQIKNAAETFARQLESGHLDQVIQDVGKLTQSLSEKIAKVNIDGAQLEVLQLVKEVRKTNSKLQTILDNPDIPATLSNVAETSASLKTASAKVDTILADPQTKKLLADASTLAASASPAAADLRRMLRRLDTLIAAKQDDLGAILEGIRHTVENTEQWSDDAKHNPGRLIFGEPPPRSKVSAEGEGK